MEETKCRETTTLGDEDAFPESWDFPKSAFAGKE